MIPRGTKKSVLVSWYFKNGRPFIYDCISPRAVFGYIPQESSAQTPKLVQKKKNKLNEIPASVPDKTLFTLRFLNMFMAKMGSMKPLQVKTNIFELPINKSDNATIPKVNKSVDFLSK